MRKLLLFLTIFASIAFGQDATQIINANGWASTLSASRDTIDVYFDTQFQYLTISALTSSGTDSINVYTKDYAGAWVQKNLISNTEGIPYDFIPLSTTKKEYIVRDPEILALRLICPDITTGTITFAINLKRQNK